MSLQNRPLLGTAVQERDVDLVLTQLVETSPIFREWICNQIRPGIEIDQYMSVCRSVGTTTGESDLEIALKTTDGDRFLILIENKINAELQDNQAERYFKRGEQYVQRDICDNFEVGLTAPENYINQRNPDAFGGIVSYESILEKLDSMSYDATPFAELILEQAIEKQAAGHTARPEVTMSIRTRFEEREEEFPEIFPYDQSNNLLKFRSTHPKHPDIVRYIIWVIGNTDGRETMVRLSLDSDASEEEISALQRFAAEHFDGLDGYELHEESTMWTVRTTVTTERDKRVTNDEYIDEIISELARLVAYYHPKLVESGL